MSVHTNVRVCVRACVSVNAYMCVCTRACVRACVCARAVSRARVCARLAHAGYHPNILRGATGPRGDPSASIVLGIVVIAGLVRSLGVLACVEMNLTERARARARGTEFLGTSISHTSITVHWCK